MGGDKVLAAVTVTARISKRRHVTIRQYSYYGR